MRNLNCYFMFLKGYTFKMTTPPLPPLCGICQGPIFDHQISFQGKHRYWPDCVAHAMARILALEQLQREQATALNAVANRAMGRLKRVAATSNTASISSTV